jgi:hypothetical protein
MILGFNEITWVVLVFYKNSKITSLLKIFSFFKYGRLLA